MITPKEINVDLLEWWKENYGKYAPLGHVLRFQKAEHWVRIHSLPKSKRYPQTNEEYDILLQRHNEVGDYLFNPNEPCILFK